MADPLTALGAAGNIVQLVQFGIDLFSSSRDVYRSTQGATKDNIFLGSVVKDLHALCGDISLLSAGGGVIKPFVTEAQDLAQQLLDALDKLQTGSSHRKWGSFKVALKTVWGEKDIQGYYDKLLKLQTNLSLRMQFQLLSV